MLLLLHRTKGCGRAPRKKHARYICRIKSRIDIMTRSRDATKRHIDALVPKHQSWRHLHPALVIHTRFMLHAKRSVVVIELSLIFLSQGLFMLRH